jgi:release factor glutamine methyltransferase
MTVSDALKEGTGFLMRAETDTPFLDASLLLAQVLKLSREKLFAAYPEAIDETDYRCFRELLDRRAQGIPVSYIRNRKEFYGLAYFVDERVLVPRPDTETLIEEASALLEADGELKRVLDLGTGSGCIAITLKHLHPRIEMTGSDISSPTGEVFQVNAKAILSHPLPFILSDLFDKIDGIFDFVVSNPPYIEGEKVKAMMKTGWPEPQNSLAGGPDGTDLLVKIIAAAPQHLAKGGFLLLEAAPEQMKKLRVKMEECGYINISIRKDLAGRDRVIRGRRPVS